MKSFSTTLLLLSSIFLCSLGNSRSMLSNLMRLEPQGLSTNNLCEEEEKVLRQPTLELKDLGKTVDEILVSASSSNFSSSSHSPSGSSSGTSFDSTDSSSSKSTESFSCRGMATANEICEMGLSVLFGILFSAVICQCILLAISISVIGNVSVWQCLRS